MEQLELFLEEEVCIEVFSYADSLFGAYVKMGRQSFWNLQKGDKIEINFDDPEIKFCPGLWGEEQAVGLYEFEIFKIERGYYGGGQKRPNIIICIVDQFDPGDEGEYDKTG